MAFDTGKVITNSSVATVTNTQLASMAANTVKANATASSATPTDVAVGASQLFGRGASGDVSAIALGAGLGMTGTTLAVTPTFPDSTFTLQDDGDATKQARFQLSSISTGTTRTYTLPNTTGQFVLDVLTTTTLGNSTASTTLNIGTAATLSGNTKTVNLGTSGASGSTTTVTIGASASGANSSTVNFGDQFTKSTAPAVITGAATLTNANLQTTVINYTGAAAAVTFPLGSTLDGLIANVDTGFDFSVINTGSGAATMTANTGVTLLGAAAVANGTSAVWRLRKTAASTFVAMRLS